MAIAYNCLQLLVLSYNLQTQNISTFLLPFSGSCGPATKICLLIQGKTEFTKGTHEEDLQSNFGSFMLLDFRGKPREGEGGLLDFRVYPCHDEWFQSSRIVMLLVYFSTHQPY